ncbi:hypothetical protein [Leifsonia sp. Leaf264]|uniref:hypothetical protein n=1 Tax=Leifsonia sp. Leaf264 TaxID=1736314 RepID=UPI000701A016|nr:hypothetical protein [Leifsonia sp. Leaf264]KQO98878.1 hypothetical protein ASF30_12510 [Leifsonia sp. Leaf264]
MTHITTTATRSEVFELSDNHVVLLTLLGDAGRAYATRVPVSTDPAYKNDDTVSTFLIQAGKLKELRHQLDDLGFDWDEAHPTIHAKDFGPMSAATFGAAMVDARSQAAAFLADGVTFGEPRVGAEHLDVSRVRVHKNRKPATVQITVAVTVAFRINLTN